MWIIYNVSEVSRKYSNQLIFNLYLQLLWMFDIFVCLYGCLEKLVKLEFYYVFICRHIFISSFEQIILQFILDMISSVATITLLIVLTSSLHVSHKQTLVSPSQNIGQTAQQLSYIQGLIAANTAYSNKITDNKAFIQFMERAIKIEMEDLYEFQANIIPTLSIGPNTCSNITDAQRDQLLSKLDCAMNNLANLTKYIAFNTNATVSDDLERRAVLQYQYLNEVRKALNDQCSSNQTISTTVYFYNLNSSTALWVFGSNATPLTLVQLYSQLAAHGTVTICPPEKPFVIAGKTGCFACGNHSIFDLTLQACVKCPGNTTYNATTHQCECPCHCSVTSDGLCIPKLIFYTNGNYLNLAGLNNNSFANYTQFFGKYINNPKYIQGSCALDENSVFTGCKKCSNGTYFIVDTYDCQPCDSIDAATHQCLIKNAVSNSTTTTTTTTTTAPTVTAPTTTTPTTTTPTSQVVTTQTIQQLPTSVQPTGVAPTVTYSTTTTNNTAITQPTGVVFIDPIASNPTTTAPVTNTTTNTAPTTTPTTSTINTAPTGVQPIASDLVPASSITSSNSTTGTAPIASNTSSSSYQSSNQTFYRYIFASDPSLIETTGTECPQETPFFTGSSSNPCIACPSTFNWDSKACEECPEGTEIIANLCL